MLKETKKYKDLFRCIEGKIAIGISVISTYFISKFLINKPIDFINGFLIDIAIIFIPCLVALLGIVFTGFAFVSGTISLKATDNLYKKNKIDSITSIFFTFYFLGWIVAITILLYFLVLIMALSEWAISYVWITIVSFFVIYFTIFSILYLVGLFDTCIQMFFVNYKFNKIADDTDDTNS